MVNFNYIYHTALRKPIVGAGVDNSIDTWGATLNADLEYIDQNLFAIGGVVKIRNVSGASIELGDCCVFVDGGEDGLIFNVCKAVPTLVGMQQRLFPARCIALDTMAAGEDALGFIRGLLRIAVDAHSLSINDKHEITSALAGDALFVSTNGKICSQGDTTYPSSPGMLQRIGIMMPQSWVNLDFTRDDIQVL